tara:strand:- start:393 stop:695 length:303 start_codon:yes stop_codon:yes gene_type:complete
MKKLLPIILLVIFACSDDEDLEACNELVSSLNEAQTTWQDVEATYELTGEYVDGATDLCTAYFDGIKLLIVEGCPNDLGTWQGYTAAQIDSTSAVECDLD